MESQLVFSKASKTHKILRVFFVMCRPFQNPQFRSSGVPTTHPHIPLDRYPRTWVRGELLLVTSSHNEPESDARGPWAQPLGPEGGPGGPWGALRRSRRALGGGLGGPGEALRRSRGRLEGALEASGERLGTSLANGPPKEARSPKTYENHLFFLIFL